MNTEKIQNKVTLWKDIKVFPSFYELKHLCKKENTNRLKYIFVNDYKDCFIICFNFMPTDLRGIEYSSLVEIYNERLFKNINNTFIQTNLEYIEMPKITLNGYNFTKKFFRYIADFEGIFEKYCYLNDFYQLYLNSLNI